MDHTIGQAAHRPLRALLGIGLCLSGAQFSASCVMAAAEPSARGFSVVKRYLAAHNRGDSAAVLKLYAADAVFHLSDARGVVSGQAGLRRLVEFDRAAGSHVAPFGASVEQGGGVTRVSFQGVVERSSVYAAFGLPRVVTQPIRDAFIISRGRVSVVRQPDLLPVCRRIVAAAMPLYSVWLKSNRPAVFQNLMPGGKLKIEAQLIAPWVMTIKEWRVATGWRPDPTEQADCLAGRV